MAKLLFSTVSVLAFAIAFAYQVWPELQSRLALIFRPSFSTCETPAYKVRILSYDPLIMHLQNFITEKERLHMLEVSENNFARSTALHHNGTEVVYPGRTSSSAILNASDPAARCIYERVSEFQGYHAINDIETLQLTRYQKGQQFENHVDWYPKNHTGFLNSGFNRITTIFATLEATCEHCGTRFPNVTIDWRDEDEKWCDAVECEDTEHLTVKAVPGSAIFWKNLLPSGDGDPRAVHAGLPLEGGVKIGLNIWSRSRVD